MDAQAGANTPGWLHSLATRLEQASTDVLEKKMTPKRLIALTLVAEGRVVHHMATRMGPVSGYAIRGQAGRGHESSLKWLRENGYIQHDAPSMRGTKVSLTRKAFTEFPSLAPNHPHEEHR